jgi:hypothetical protein
VDDRLLNQELAPGEVRAHGLEVIAVPMVYLSEARRDPTDFMLKYGATPARARAPWFLDAEPVYRVASLPDLITGEGGHRVGLPSNPSVTWLAGLAEAYREESGVAGTTRLLRAIGPEWWPARADWAAAHWHVHVDPGLNRGRKGDAAGLAVGRIVDEALVVTGDKPRIVKRFVVPIALQIVAPAAGEIFLSAISRFILEMRGILGINISSFSYDSFQSISQIQELKEAGLVTAGLKWNEQWQRLDGWGKPYSVDRTVLPHQELKEAINEQRIALANYPILTHELTRLEDIWLKAPDHPVGGSKDVADAVAGVIGYLTEFGHADLQVPVDTFFSTAEEGVPITTEHWSSVEGGGARLRLEPG